MKLAIRRINLMSLGKVGCFLGLLLALLPSLLCGILGVAIAQVLRHWLEGWEELSISLLGQTIVSFDLVHTLGLAEFLNRLQVIGDASWLVVALVVLVLGLLTGLMLASITVLAGLAYNLLATATGGVVVDAAVVDERTTAPSRREPAIRRES
jgi:hypothetical protein